MLHSQYRWENNGDTSHHGHRADCHPALTNVVDMQMNLVAIDKKILCWKRTDIRSVKWTSGVKSLTINSSAIVGMQKNTLFLFTEEETLWLPMTRNSWEAVAGAVRKASSGSSPADTTRENDPTNVANITKTTSFNWHINTNHDLHTLHLCTDQE